MRWNRSGVIGASCLAVLLVVNLRIGRSGTTAQCDWASAEYESPPAQRVALIVGDSVHIALSSRREPAELGAQRVLTLHGPRSNMQSLPTLPDDYESVHAARTPDGRLLVFWTTARQPREPFLPVGELPEQRKGLYSTVLEGDRWSPAEAVYEDGEVPARNASGIFFDEHGRAHFLSTAYLPSSGMPRLLHFHGRHGAWSVAELRAPGFLYPRLAAVANGGMVLVSVGAIPGETDGNSVWSTRYDAATGGWGEPVLVSRSGPRAAFEPALLSSDHRLDAVWAKDLDGERSTRESLWHAFSLDGGRTWSRPVQVAIGRHIWRPALVPDGGRVAVLYLVSELNGSPGELHMAALEGHRWRAPRRVLGARVSDFAATAPRPGEIRVVFSTYDPESRLAQPGVYSLRGLCGRKGAVSA